MHQLRLDKRWALPFIKSCKGVPGEVRPSTREITKPTGDEEERSKMAPLPVIIPAVPQTRRFYVLKADIEKYGPTETCMGCTEIGVHGKNHTAHDDTCRARIMELMARDEDAKML